MSEIDDNARRTFDGLWKAQRALAYAEQVEHRAELAHQGARAELEAAQATVAHIEQEMKRLAMRAAGVDSPPTDDADVPPPRRSDGFVPVRSRSF